MLKVDNLTVSYYGDEVVSNVSFEFDTGSLIGIIGPNGAGKSTMIKAILNLIPKDSGEVTVNGQPIIEHQKKIAYIPQRTDLDWDFPIDVFDTVLMGTYPSLGLFNKPKKKERDLASESLKRVGMLDYKHQQIGELSGGQQQRVFLARALSQQADIFFLDEPFVGIDIDSEKQIIKILKELKAEGKMVFVVNHDLSKVESYFDSLILLNRKLIKAGLVKDVFVQETMAEAYETQLGLPALKAVGV